MSKIVYFTILSVLLLAAVTALNVYGLNAREPAKFVPVSVLAQDQADYGVDENASTVPAVSPAIIEDKMHDLIPPGTVKLIPYTILPPQNAGPADEDNDPSQAADQTQTKKDHGNNGHGNSDQNQNQHQNQNQNQNNNGNGQDKEHGNSKNKNNDTNKGNDTVKKNDKGSQASPKK
jgi:hypothetical protein